MTNTIPNKPCPVCGKPAIPDQTPFCSPRCKNVDLHRWMGEVYRIPTPNQTIPENDQEDEA